jgi:hypothetical protein
MIVEYVEGNKMKDNKCEIERKRLIKEKKRKIIENFNAQADREMFQNSPYFESYKRKVSSLINHHYNRGIEERINPLSEHADPRFSKIRITRSAYEKGKYIAKRVSQLAGHPNEVTLAIAGKRDDLSLLITNLYIMYDQYVEHFHYKESPRGKIQTQLDMEKNLEWRIGVAHSHIGCGVFFSPEDLKTIKKDVWKGINIEIDLLDDEPGDDSKNVSITTYLALVFSGDMSNTEEPYAGIAVSYTPFSDGESKPIIVINENVSIEIVEDGYSGLDETEIDNQLKERVYIRGDCKFGDWVNVNSKKILKEKKIRHKPYRNKLKLLEERYDALINYYKKEQERIMQRYESLQAEYQKLTERNCKLEILIENMLEQYNKFKNPS